MNWSLVNDYTDYLSYSSESICEEVPLFERADNRRLVHSCAIDSLNNSFQVFDSEVLLLFNWSLTKSRESSQTFVESISFDNNHCKTSYFMYITFSYCLILHVQTN